MISPPNAVRIRTTHTRAFLSSTLFFCWAFVSNKSSFTHVPHLLASSSRPALADLILADSSLEQWRVVSSECLSLVVLRCGWPSLVARPVQVWLSLVLRLAQVENYGPSRNAGGPQSPSRSRLAVTSAAGASAVFRQKQPCPSGTSSTCSRNCHYAGHERTLRCLSTLELFLAAELSELSRLLERA